MSFRFFVPTHLLFGAGCLSKLRKQRLPGQRALIVISNGRSTRANGYLARVEEELHAAGVETHVYDGVLPNPVLENVAAGAALARSAHCDFIVGLGGGSSIDCAKAIAVMATNDGSFWDYLFGGTAGRKKMKADPLPLVAIPTTAGTGTELDPWMVVSNEETHEKIGGGNDRCFPVLSVVDPELMTTLPPRLTAFQGFDALFHGIECYLSKQASPLSDLFSREVVSSVAGHLARACTNGQDIAAREQVAYGSTLAGVSMTLSSNGSHHAMEHALSAFHHELPHGEGLILLSRAYFGHLAYHVPEVADRLVDLARLMGRPDASDPHDFLTALDELLHACGVAGLRMSDHGITPDEIPALARNARETMGMLFATDRFSLTETDVERIYAKALAAEG